MLSTTNYYKHSTAREKKITSKDTGDNKREMTTNICFCRWASIQSKIRLQCAQLSTVWTSFLIEQLTTIQRNNKTVKQWAILLQMKASFWLSRVIMSAALLNRSLLWYAHYFIANVLILICEIMWHTWWYIHLITREILKIRRYEKAGYTISLRTNRVGVIMHPFHARNSLFYIENSAKSTDSTCIKIGQQHLNLLITRKTIILNVYSFCSKTTRINS